MHCEDHRTRLEAYASGRLSPGEREATEAHLQDCEDCTRGLARIDNLAAVLGQVRTPPVPTGFAARLMATGRNREIPMTAAGWTPVPWWRQLSMPMRAAAAAMLIVGLGLGLVMGRAATLSPVRATPVTAQADALDTYNLDYLSEAPAGSLADSYLTLVALCDEGGR